MLEHTLGLDGSIIAALKVRVTLAGYVIQRRFYFKIDMAIDQEVDPGVAKLHVPVERFQGRKHLAESVFPEEECDVVIHPPLVDPDPPLLPAARQVERDCFDGKGSLSAPGTPGEQTGNIFESCDPLPPLFYGSFLPICNEQVRRREA